jgi:hypothetical protein
MFCAAATFFIAILCTPSLPSAPATTSFQQEVGAVVPFVGCKSTRVLDPMEMPDEFYANPYRGKPIAVHLPAEITQRLAYYKSEHLLGVLAPRGWHCFAPVSFPASPCPDVSS